MKRVPHPLSHVRACGAEIRDETLPNASCTIDQLVLPRCNGIIGKDKHLEGGKALLEHI